MKPGSRGHGKRAKPRGRVVPMPRLRGRGRGKVSGPRVPYPTKRIGRNNARPCLPPPREVVWESDVESQPMNLKSRNRTPPPSPAEVEISPRGEQTTRKTQALIEQIKIGWSGKEFVMQGKDPPPMSSSDDNLIDPELDISFEYVEEATKELLDIFDDPATPAIPPPKAMTTDEIFAKMEFASIKARHHRPLMRTNPSIPSPLNFAFQRLPRPQVQNFLSPSPFFDVDAWAYPNGPFKSPYPEMRQNPWVRDISSSTNATYIRPWTADLLENGPMQSKVDTPPPSTSTSVIPSSDVEMLDLSRIKQEVEDYHSDETMCEPLEFEEAHSGEIDLSQFDIEGLEIEEVPQNPVGTSSASSSVCEMTEPEPEPDQSDVEMNEVPVALVNRNLFSPVKKPSSSRRRAKRRQGPKIRKIDARVIRNLFHEPGEYFSGSESQTSEPEPQFSQDENQIEIDDSEDEQLIDYKPSSSEDEEMESECTTTTTTSNSE